MFSHIPSLPENARAGQLAPATFPVPAVASSPALGAPSDVLVALTYGLELMQHGALLVDGTGRVHLANQAAHSILQKRDGIAIVRSELVADRASDMRLLQKLLREAITSPRRGEPKGSPLIVGRKYAHTPLIVRVVPGPSLDCWKGEQQKTALLKIYDRDTGLNVDERALVSLYGLTRGEASLAARLVQGKSIEDAAAESFISPHTARTHLKRIFMKTDTHRQSEMVVRILLTVL